MKYNKALIVIVAFFFILLLLLSLGLVMEDQPYSSEEARSLAQRPVFDFSDLDALFRNIDDYTVDQFPYRRDLLKYFTNLEILQGKKTVRDAYIADDEWIFSKTYRADFINLFKSMERAADKYEDKDLYYFVLPVKNHSLPNMDPLIVDKASNFNLKTIYSRFEDNPDINMVDAASYFRDNYSQEKMEELWFKGDFHWNALGASEAVYYLLDIMYENGSINEVDRSLVDFLYIHSKFQGDLNRRFSNYFTMDEDIMVVESKDADDFQYFFSLDDSKPTSSRWDIVGNSIGADPIDYNGLYTSNLPFYRVVNPRAANESTLLILKDSMQNPTTDIFASYFRQVIVVDPRFEMAYSFEELASISNMVVLMLHQNNPAEETAEYLQ